MSRTTLALFSCMALLIAASSTVFALDYSIFTEAQNTFDSNKDYQKDSSSSAAEAVDVVFRVKFGDIGFKLLFADAPKTCYNFMNLVNAGFYNGKSWFYRHCCPSQEFVLQAGNIVGSNKTVPLEYRVPNDIWTVGLARDSHPDSGSSEFFVNIANNSKILAPNPAKGTKGYAVFAKVVSGFNVLRDMIHYPTIMNKSMGMYELNPPVEIIKAHVVRT